MIQCVFTLDYEIYGDGRGSLEELAVEPAERLRGLFRKFDARFVVFPDAAELEMIEATASDRALPAVKAQLRQLGLDAFEIGLHLHPWWYNGSRHDGHWSLDHSEYNLCALPNDRIATMIDRSLAYLRATLGKPTFVPLSFRAGHLLFRPAERLARILVARGIKVDSSVYKGGVWRQQNLDYRPALANGYHWRFTKDSVVPEADGALLEVPIHTDMVPSWKMLTAKRVGLEQKGSSLRASGAKWLRRARDLAQLRRAQKFDFCALSFDEMKTIVDRVLRDDQSDPGVLRPVVAIGHTKDLVDYVAVERLLEYLQRNDVRISGFSEVHQRCELGCPVPAL